MSIIFRKQTAFRHPIYSSSFLDDSGFTVFTSSIDSRLVYVSDSTGSNAYNGLHPTYIGGTSGPVSTISAGLSLLRDGYPDFICFKAGDTWVNQQVGSFSKSGRSPTERMIFSSYGNGERPKIITNNTQFIYCPGGSVINHLAFIGLELNGSASTGQNGIDFIPNATSGYSNILIEDCLIHRYAINIIISKISDTPCSGISIRRNIIASSFAAAGNDSHGCFLYSIDGLRLEENLFYRNGWSGLDQWSNRKHSAYLQTNTNPSDNSRNVYVLDNIVASGDGIQVRCGGTVSGNVGTDYTSFLNIGDAAQPTNGGISALMYNNVCTDSQTDGAGGGGAAFRFGNLSSCIIRNNIAGSGNAAAGLGFWFRQPAGYPVCSSVLLSSNIVHNLGYISLALDGAVSAYSNFSAFNNQFQNPNNTGGNGNVVTQTNLLTSSQITASGNHYCAIPGTASNMYVNRNGGNVTLATWLGEINDTTSNSTSATYVDPNRTFRSYSASLGNPATLEGIAAKLLAQRKGNWDTRYTAKAIRAYLEAGFI